LCPAAELSKAKPKKRGRIMGEERDDVAMDVDDFHAFVLPLDA
jgi:hypothetical protein